MQYAAILALVAVASASPTPYRDNRIVGGTPTTIDQVPWQVSLRLLGGHTCGASILNPTHIVTAGHCVDFPSSYYTVRTGTTYKGTPSPAGDIHVEAKLRHEQYSSSSIDYDVALMRLTQPLQYSDTVQPIEMIEEHPPVGSNITVTGWGTLVSGGSTPDQLQTVVIRAVSDADCLQAYPDTFSPRQFCAADDGKDSCQGDSGGPLVYQGKQVGIVSYGRGCALPGYPGVNTKIAAVRDWILEHANF